jgi:hypothetical protein
MKQWKEIASTTRWLLQRELTILYKNAFDSLIDCLIIPLTFIVISGFILPYMGMPADYGAFMAVGACMMMSWNSCAWFGAGPMIADLESDRSITYQLTLPLPAWMIVIKYALGFAIYGVILNVLTIPIGKVLLGSRFDLSNFSWIKFALIYPSANVMFGFLAVAIALWVNNSFEFGRFWARIGVQLTLFSGLQFSWHTFHQVWPTIAYIDLLNPLVYAFEGTRAAVMGQAGNLNFWLCLFAVWTWSIVFALASYKLLKKRLDCV